MSLRILQGEQDLRGLIPIVRGLDWINDTVGRAVSLLTILMVLNVFLVVVLRYFFSIGWIWMQESYTWMHGTVFMLGAGYTLLHNGHVRIDVFYRTASARYQAVVNIIGTTFLLFPLLWITWTKAVPMVQRSFGRLEASPEAGGLPGLFLIKGVILAFCVLFALQGLSLVLRSLLTLAGIDVEKAEDDSPTEAAEGL